MVIKLDGQKMFSVELPIDKHSFTILHSELSSDQTYIANFIVRSIQGDSTALSKNFSTSIVGKCSDMIMFSEIQPFIYYNNILYVVLVS